jgi:hypothetical protein
MRSVFARILIALAALMVLPGSAWGRVHYLCHMNGRVQSSCCCEQKAVAAEPKCAASVRASDCCERLTPSDGTKATSARAPTDSVQPAALVTVIPAPVYLGPRLQAAAVAVRRSRGPPRPKHPLFVVHCAYLC